MQSSKMKTATIKIVGMHCASCVALNERNLKKVQGVANASVNFATHSAFVEYDEKFATEENLYAAIRKGGYRVMTTESFEAQKKEAQKELKNAGDKAFIAIALAAPIFILAMFKLEFPLTVLGYNASLWLQLILSSFVILILGQEFHRGMVQRARMFTADMDTLISLGTLAALFYSIWAMYAHQAHFYFETGAVIAALILLGRYFEARSRGQASDAIEKLLELGAKTARVIREGKELQIPIEEVAVNDLILLKP